MAKATATAEAAAEDAEAAAADAHRTSAYGEQLEGLVGHLERERGRVAESHAALDALLASAAPAGGDDGRPWEQQRGVLLEMLRKEREEREEAVGAFEGKLGEILAHVSNDAGKASARHECPAFFSFPAYGPNLLPLMLI